MPKKGKKVYAVVGMSILLLSILLCANTAAAAETDEGDNEVASEGNDDAEPQETTVTVTSDGAPEDGDTPSEEEGVEEEGSEDEPVDDEDPYGETIGMSDEDVESSETPLGDEAPAEDEMVTNEESQDGAGDGDIEDVQADGDDPYGETIGIDENDLKSNDGGSGDDSDDEDEGVLSNSLVQVLLVIGLASLFVVVAYLLSRKN